MIEHVLADAATGSMSESLYRFALERLGDGAAPSYRCVLASMPLPRGDVDRALSMLKDSMCAIDPGFAVSACVIFRKRSGWSTNTSGRAGVP